MRLTTQDRELIHDLQVDGVLAGDPQSKKISRQIQDQYKLLKDYVDEAKKDPAVPSHRHLGRAAKTFMEVLSLFWWEFAKKKKPHDVAWKILEDLAQNRLDVQDLRYFSPEILEETKETYQKLKASHLAISFAKGASFAKLREKLDPQSLESAIKSAGGGWETELDKRIQFALASFFT